MPPKTIFMPFEEARGFVRALNLKNNREWRVWCKSSSKSPLIPTTPEREYKEDWVSWGDWLGNKNVAFKVRKTLQFEDARAYVHQLGLKNRAEWKAWADSDARPLDIPKTPSDAYKDKWLGVGDWTGFSHFMSEWRRLKNQV